MNGVNSFATGLQRVYFMISNYLESFVLIPQMLESYIIMESQLLFLNHYKTRILVFFQGLKDYQYLKILFLKKRITRF